MKNLKVLHNIYEGDEINSELAKYAIHMGELRNVYKILSRMKRTDHFGDIGLPDKILLTMYLKKVWCVNINWIQLAYDMFQCRAVMFNTVTNLPISEQVDTFYQLSDCLLLQKDSAPIEFITYLHLRSSCHFVLCCIKPLKQKHRRFITKLSINHLAVT